MAIADDIRIARNQVSSAGEAAGVVSTSEAQAIIDRALASGLSPDAIRTAFDAERDTTGSLSRFDFLVDRRVTARADAVASASEPSLLESAGRVLNPGGTAAADLGVHAGGALADSVGRSGMHTHGGARHSYATETEAIAGFATARTRLLDVNNWTNFSGFENASFALFDSSGHAVTRPAAVGDFVRVDLPGPGGYDWVRIESVSDTADRVSIVVRPTYDPTASPLRTGVTAHFFTSEATNTFTIARSGTDVRMSVDGRNEHANTGSESGDPTSAMRNRGAAEGAWGDGAGTGGSAHQWNRFSGLILE